MGPAWEGCQDAGTRGAGQADGWTDGQVCGPLGDPARKVPQIQLGRQPPAVGSTAGPLPPPDLRPTSQLCDLRHVSYPLCASLPALGKGLCAEREEGGVRPTHP